MELSDAFSPLDYFRRRFGGAGGSRYLGDDNPVSVIPSGDLKQLGLQVHSSDRIAVLVCFD